MEDTVVHVMMGTVWMEMVKGVHVSGRSFIFFYYVISHLMYIAICTDDCGHCDECTKPSVCTCVDGWTGNDCCEGNRVCYM